MIWYQRAQVSHNADYYFQKAVLVPKVQSTAGGTLNVLCYVRTLDRLLHYYEVQAWTLPYIKAARAPLKRGGGAENRETRRKKKKKGKKPCYH